MREEFYTALLKILLEDWYFYNQVVPHGPVYYKNGNVFLKEKIAYGVSF